MAASGPPPPLPRGQWAPPTNAAPADWQRAVEDPADRIDVEASPAAWLSARTLLILTVVVLGLLAATVIACLLYWVTPTLQVVPVPSVPRG